MVQHIQAAAAAVASAINQIVHTSKAAIYKFNHQTLQYVIYM